MKTLRVPRAAYKWERHGNIVTLFELWSAKLPTRILADDIEGVLGNLCAEGHLRPGDRIICRGDEVATIEDDTVEHIGAVARRVVARLRIDE
jgi:hypothetical protein